MSFRAGQVVESRPDFVESDLARDQWSYVHCTVSYRAQRRGEFAYVIGENELHVDLFGYREKRMHGVGLHTHARDHQPSAWRGSSPDQE